MPRKKRKKEKKAKTHSSPLPSHHQTQSSPPLKKKIAQHRLVSTNDFLFDEDGIIIAESDDTGLTRPFDRGSEASDRQEAAKKADKKNVPRIDAQRFRMLLEMAK